MDLKIILFATVFAFIVLFLGIVFLFLFLWKKGVPLGLEKVFKENRENSDKLKDSFEVHFEKLNHKIEGRLDQGLKKTSDTFTEVMMRLSKIDEAQKKIEQLSAEVVSLQDVLTDKKSRGVFGEVQLKHILASVFGEVGKSEKGESKFYQMQYKLSSGSVADAILFLPQPVGRLCVDSKFPLENYRRMHDQSMPDQEKEKGRKNFKADVKRHIDTIASKYIIKSETSEQAVMFLPAEAIFAEIHAHHSDVITHSQKKESMDHLTDDLFCLPFEHSDHFEGY